MRKGCWMPYALAAVLLAAASTAGHAIMSLGGPTGIVSMPNAQVAASGQLDLALGYESLEMYGRGDDYTIWQLQALRSVSDEVEVWATYSNIDDGFDGSGWGLGGKWQFIRQPALVAAGLSYHTADVGPGQGYLPVWSADSNIDAWKAYVVATRDLTPNQPNLQVLGTVGLMLIDFDVSSGLGVGGAVDDRLLQPFVGVELVSAGGTAAGVEYRWDDESEADPVLSAVLRTPLSEGAFWEIGTTNAYLVGLGSDERGAFVRVVFTTEI
jgi:hypothetical protein